MSLYFNDDELYERTKFRQRKKQCAELARQGVKFTVRWDGFPLVDRSQFQSQPTKKAEPRFEYGKTA